MFISISPHLTPGTCVPSRETERGNAHPPPCPPLVKTAFHHNLAWRISPFILGSSILYLARISLALTIISTSLYLSLSLFLSMPPFFLSCYLSLALSALFHESDSSHSLIFLLSSLLPVNLPLVHIAEPFPASASLPNLSPHYHSFERRIIVLSHPSSPSVPLCFCGAHALSSYPLVASYHRSCRLRPAYLKPKPNKTNT